MGNSIVGCSYSAAVPIASVWETWESAVGRSIVLSFRAEEIIIFPQIRRTPLGNVYRTYYRFRIYYIL